MRQITVVLADGKTNTYGSTYSGFTQALPSMSGSWKVKISGNDNNVEFIIKCSGGGTTNSASHFLNWNSSSVEPITVGTGTPGPKITVGTTPNDGVIARNEIGTIWWKIKDADSCVIKVLDGKALAVQGSSETPFEKNDSFPISSTSRVLFDDSVTLKFVSGVSTKVNLEFKCVGAGYTVTNWGDLRLDTSGGLYNAPPEIEEFKADPDAIAEAKVGDWSEIRWAASNASSCKIGADAYLEIFDERETATTTWSSVRGLLGSVTAQGKARVKPGYVGSQVPKHSEQRTVTNPGFGDSGGTTSTITVEAGDGTRMEGTNTGFVTTPSNPPAVVTLVCYGPIEKPGLTPPGKVEQSITVKITPTPSSGGGSDW